MLTSQDDSFRPIPEFLGYEVSRKGVVRNRKGFGRPLTVLENDQGVPYVGFTVDGSRRTTRSVPSLVAEAFMPSEKARIEREGMVAAVLHKSGNRSSVHLEDLRWAPRAYTIRYHRWALKYAPVPLEDFPIETKVYFRGRDADRQVFDNRILACMHYGIHPTELSHALSNTDEGRDGAFPIRWYEDLWTYY